MNGSGPECNGAIVVTAPTSLDVVFAGCVLDTVPGWVVVVPLPSVVTLPGVLVVVTPTVVVGPLGSVVVAPGTDVGTVEPGGTCVVVVTPAFVVGGASVVGGVVGGGGDTGALQPLLRIGCPLGQFFPA